MVGQAGMAVPLNPMHGIGERHLAVAVVVTVGFAVGGDVRELRLGVVLAEAVEQPSREALAGVQQTLKRDGA